MKRFPDQGDPSVFEEDYTDQSLCFNVPSHFDKSLPQRGLSVLFSTGLPVLSESKDVTPCAFVS